MLSTNERRHPLRKYSTQEVRLVTVMVSESRELGHFETSWNDACSTDLRVRDIFAAEKRRTFITVTSGKAITQRFRRRADVVLWTTHDHGCMIEEEWYRSQQPRNCPAVDPSIHRRVDRSEISCFPFKPARQLPVPVLKRVSDVMQTAMYTNKRSSYSS